MIKYYVSNSGDDNNDGLSWATARKTVSSITNFGSPEEIFRQTIIYIASNYDFVADDEDIGFIGVNDYSANPQAALSYVSVIEGTTTPQRGAAFTNPVNFHQTTFTGYCGYLEGIVMNERSYLTLGSSVLNLKNCAINILGEGGSFEANFENSITTFDGCDLNLMGKYNYFSRCYGELIFRGGSISSIAENPYVFTSCTRLTLEGVDLANLQGPLINTSEASRVVIRNCRLPTNFQLDPTWDFSLLAYFEGETPIRDFGLEIFLANCDVVGQSTSRFEYIANGTYLIRVTSVYATDGVTEKGVPVSWNLQTKAAIWPFGAQTPEIFGWSSSVGSPVTFEVEVLANTPNLNNQMAWIDLEFQGSSTSTNSTWASSGLGSVTQTPVAVAPSNKVWINKPDGYYPYVLRVTATPQQEGPVTVRVKTGAFVDLYINPKIVQSGS